MLPLLLPPTLAVAATLAAAAILANQNYVATFAAAAVLAAVAVVGRWCRCCCCGHLLGDFSLICNDELHLLLFSCGEWLRASLSV